MSAPRKESVRSVAGPMHKCRCRRVLVVETERVTVCLCGQRYQWGTAKPAVKTVVIRGER